MKRNLQNIIEIDLNKHVVIIIPAHNEEKSLQAVLWEVREQFGGEVVVVDDASSDNTRQVARMAGATVIPLYNQLGAWGAIQAGFRYAVKRHYHIAVTLDADGQHIVEHVPVLIDPIIHREADMVIGAAPIRGNLSRRMAWRLFRFLSGIRISDPTSGFRAYNRNAMKILTDVRGRLLDYQDLGVLLLLNRVDLTVTEREVNMRRRMHGQSRIFNSWFRVASYMLHTLVLCISHSGHLKKRPRRRKKHGKNHRKTL